MKTAEVPNLEVALGERIVVLTRAAYERILLLEKNARWHSPSDRMELRVLRSILKKGNGR
jgi:hypothetical protein